MDMFYTLSFASVLKNLYKLLIHLDTILVTKRGLENTLT